MNRYMGIPKTLRALLVAALCAATGGLLAVPVATAADAPANKLQSVDVQPLSGQGVQLVMTTSGPAPEPLSFTIDNPARISFDLPDTALALAQRRIDVRSGGLDSILAAEANGRSRLVLNLDRMLPYQTRIEGNKIIVTLGEAARAAVPASAGARTTSAAAAAPARTGGRAIQNLDFRRSSDGTATGRLIVKLSDPRTPINLNQQGNQILVDFVGADLPKNLQRSFDVADFATPVSGFNALRTPTGTQVVITAAGDFEQLAYQSDDQYVIEVQPRRLAKAPTDEKPVYSGERMSANFQDIETRTLLQLIADQSGKNIFVTDSVKGSVTLRVDRVPWDQVLDLVLQLQGLDKRVQDNVIIVGPTEELANREKAALAARKDIQDLAPLRTEYLQINYAKAEDIAALIQSQSGGGKTLLSSRGSVSIDNRTNTLLIQDTADSIANVRQLVSTLDIPVRQVRIEARIVVVSEDFSRDLGVRLGFTGTESNGANGLFATSGTSTGVDTMLSSALDNLQSTGSPYPVSVPTGSGAAATGSAASRYNVNLPAPSPAGSLAWAILGSDYIVDLELSAAQSEGRGEVISQPSIITANQKEAVISQGTEIPYQEASSSGASTITFKPALLELKVTPLITPDNRLILDISVKKDRVGQVVVTAGGVNVPAIDTSQLTTTVFIGDGQTVVLGGILETERRENEKKVPYLGDIPVLGHLFKSTGRVNNKDELLIFVTPKILREGASVN
jgi:type IV pilus assembly protein PilQ